MTIQKRTKKILVIAVIIAIGIFGLYKIGRSLRAGSYPFAETYELDYSEGEVIAAIQRLKKEDPQLDMPKDFLNYTDGQQDFWYFFYFSYPDKNVILQTWIRPSTKEKTTLAFVSTTNGLRDSRGTLQWKFVNDDFGFLENRKLKKEFEERILSKIKLKLQIN